MSLLEEKAKLREEIKLKMYSLSLEEVFERSRKIKENLFSLHKFEDAKTILFYISFDNEVFTHDMITESFSIGKKILVSKMKKAGEMDIYLMSKAAFHNPQYFKQHKFGFLEPVDEAHAKYSGKIDLIIVPGLAFDKEGNRLGRGFGFYDRFLSNHETEKIALAFDLQLYDRIPHNERDVKMDKIIIESRIISF